MAHSGNRKVEDRQQQSRPAFVASSDRARSSRARRARIRWHGLAPRTRRLVAAAALVLVMLTGTAGVSYGQALAAPGDASWSVRTVDWLRDHGFGNVINTIENWYYTRHPPSNSAPPPSALPTQAHRSTTARPAFVAGPYPLRLVPHRAPLPGEGRWVAGRADSRGKPLLYTSYLRPDPDHASVVAGVAWIRQTGTVAHLVAGTAQPGGSGWPGNASVPREDVPRLVATFNSGWRMKDIIGAVMIHQQKVGELIPGLASAAIDDRGRLTVGEWGRDVSHLSQLAAVRQNLALIVDNSKIVSGLDVNAQGRWGSAHNQLQYTARSGLGIDKNGNLIYVAGTGMNLSTLANTLQAAGAVRAMQLDIHRQMIHFASWQSTGTGRMIPTKLIPAMTHSARRYLQPDQRDFFYITADPSAQ